MKITKSVGGIGVMALCLVVLGAMVAPGANADTVVTLTTTSCGSSTCPLATYTVTITPTGGNNYTVSLDILIDPSATILSGTDDHISSVDVKFASSLASASLDTAASLNIGSGWSTGANVSLNNSDCSGSGNGFICSQDAGSGLLISDGGEYKWVWNVTTADGSSLTDSIHIGANYNPHYGYVISQEVAVPEPGTLALLSLSLAGLISVRRRLFAD